MNDSEILITGIAFKDQHIILEDKEPRIIDLLGGIYNVRPKGVIYNPIGETESCQFYYTNKQFIKKYVSIKYQKDANPLEQLYRTIEKYKCKWVHFAYIDYLDVDIEQLQNKFPELITSVDFGGDLSGTNTKQIVNNASLANFVFCNSNFHFLHQLDISGTLITHNLTGSFATNKTECRIDCNFYTEKQYLITAGAGDAYAASIIENVLDYKKRNDISIQYCLSKNHLTLAHIKAQQHLEEINEKI